MKVKRKMLVFIAAFMLKKHILVIVVADGSKGSNNGLWKLESRLFTETLAILIDKTAFELMTFGFQ